MSNTHFTPNGAANHAADATKPAATAAFRVLSVARRAAAVAWKPALFAVLMWVAAAAGEIPIPGTPVPITLQTFVVMLAGLMLTWRQAGSAVAAYLIAGAVGLPVFAGGASTMALVGPSAGFLIGFLPGVVVIALLRGKAGQAGQAGRASAGSAHRAAAGHDSIQTVAPITAALATALTALRYFAAAIVGGVAVVYAFGFLIQSALTGLPLATVALASMGFVIGDVVKAAVASLAAAGLARLR